MVWVVPVAIVLITPLPRLFDDFLACHMTANIHISEMQRVRAGALKLPQTKGKFRDVWNFQSATTFIWKVALV